MTAWPSTRAMRVLEALLWEEVLRTALPDGLSQDARGAVYAGLEVQALVDAVTWAGGVGLWRMLVRHAVPVLK